MTIGVLAPYRRLGIGALLPRPPPPLRRTAATAAAAAVATPVAAAAAAAAAAVLPLLQCCRCLPEAVAATTPTPTPTPTRARSPASTRPCRHRCAGKQLLEELMKTCTSQENCVEVYLHVQVRLPAGPAAHDLDLHPSPCSSPCSSSSPWPWRVRAAESLARSQAARAGEQPGGDRLLPEVRLLRGRGHEGLLQEDRAARRGRAVQKAQVNARGTGGGLPLGRRTNVAIDLQ